jgi:hypothetical protein
MHLLRYELLPRTRGFCYIHSGDGTVWSLGRCPPMHVALLRGQLRPGYFFLLVSVSLVKYAQATHALCGTVTLILLVGRSNSSMDTLRKYSELPKPPTRIILYYH